jgi:virginiamycin B lyase
VADVRRRAALLLAGAGCAAALLAPSAAAVSITQHPLPGGALLSPELILGAPGGLLVSASSPSGAYQPLSIAGGAVSPVSQPAGPTAAAMTRGPDGNLWYLSIVLVKEAGGEEHPYAAIFEATPAGVVQRARYASTADAPVAIVAGADGALWIANDGAGDSIDRYLPGGQIVKHPTPGPPMSVVAGPDGALWFTEAGPCVGYGGPCIGRITTGGEIAYHPLPWPSGPYGIAVGPDGALWFAEWQISTIGRMTALGELQQFPVPNPTGRPVGAGGPTPMRVAAGPDGAIWFTDPGDDSIGQVTASGHVSEYPIPPLAPGERVQPVLADAVPEAIGASDGLLWVTEANARAIASVDPNGAPPPAKPAAAGARGGSAARRRARPCATRGLSVAGRRSATRAARVAAGCRHSHRARRPRSS